MVSAIGPFLTVAVAGVLLSTAAQQPARYKPAGSDYGRVYSAWDYPGAWHVQLPPSLKLVAADIGLPASDERFDPDDIDIFDAETGESFGSDPWMQRLTATGEFVDDDDPAVTNERAYRGVFIWAVPKGVRQVNFGYWGEMLFKRPVQLQGTGRVVPKPDIAAIAVAALGPAGSYERHAVILHARDWSRVATPAHYTLFSPNPLPAGAICDCDAWVEVDSERRPVDESMERRPYILKDRWFVAEYWCPSGSDPEAFNQFGHHSPLPRAQAAALGAETLARLAAAKRDELARHRRKALPPG